MGRFVDLRLLRTNKRELLTKAGLDSRGKFSIL